METSKPVTDVQSLQRLLAARDHAGFLDAFTDGHDGESARKHDDYLRALGGEGLCLLFESSPNPPRKLAKRYEALLLNGSIVAPRPVIERLATRLSSAALTELATHMERPRDRPASSYSGEPDANTTRTAFLQVRRVVQIMQMFMGDGQYSDAGGICRSVFRSQQERAFLRALSLRFPGLMALPNYPLDQIVDFDRMGPMDADTLRYGNLCRLDAILVIPDEGDPVAAFELDSRLHDLPEASRRDAMKNTLISATGLPFFRLRAESPESTTVDEWYAILSDQVLPRLDLGSRIRSRQAGYSLIPC